MAAVAGMSLPHVLLEAGELRCCWLPSCGDHSSLTRGVAELLPLAKRHVGTSAAAGKCDTQLHW